MVKINGESLEIAGRTIAQYLATTSYDIRPDRDRVQWRNCAKSSV